MPYPEDQVARLSRRKRAAFAALTLALSSALAAALLEVALRGYESWRRRRTPAPVRLALLQPNPRGTGSYRLKPNLHVVTSVSGHEVVVRTNSHGMPWREVSVEKPAGRRRIALLGDSFAFGCWADSLEKSLAGVLEGRLSTAWEVLNFGVGGYGLADMELLLREEAVRFSPDYVVVVMYNGNDFRDTFLGIDKETIVGGAAELDAENVQRKVPAELLPDDPTLSRAVADRSKVRGRLKGLALYRFLAPALRLEDLSLEFAVNRNFTMYSFWSQVPYPETALRAKDEVLAVLARMDEFLSARQARLAVVALPTSEQVYSSRLAGRDFDLDFPQVYVQVFARGRGIPYLDLLPPFRAHVQETNQPLYLRGDTHLNNDGHALAGQLMAEWFGCCVRIRGRAPVHPGGSLARPEGPH